MEYTIKRIRREEVTMIFLVLGIIIFVVGLIFFIFPAKKQHLFYGYRSYLATKNLTNWCYAQKISSRFFLLIGGIMLLIGTALKLTGNTNFFLIEMLIIPWFVVPLFGLIETKLQKFDQKTRGEQHEHIND